MLRIVLSIALLTVVCLTTPVNPATPARSTAAPKGDGPNDDAPCKTYADCGPIGLRHWNTLQATIMQENPQDGRDGDYLFPSWYAVQLSRIPYFAGPILQMDLRGHGFDPKLLDPWETTARVKLYGAPDPYAAAYHHGFDTKNGLIVAYSNDRSLDTQKKLNYGEILYHTWKTLQTRQKGSPISTLKTIIRQGVTTPETLNVLHTLYTGRQLPMDQQMWYQWTELDQEYYFWALLGTDNVLGVLELLNGHANEIGKKEITEIWTRWARPANPDIWIEVREATWMRDVVLTEGAVGTPA
ncbi:MAG: hypothetical protein Q9218_004400 [Villophora microphyllina]